VKVHPRSPPQSNLDAPRLFTFGAFRIELAGRSIHLPRRKVEALSAYLILHSQPHPREKLAALFWGDFSDAHARASLRNALAVLRKELGEDLRLTEHDLIQINSDYPLWVDTREFERQPDSEAALASYRGDLLTDFYDDWVLPLREHYRDWILGAAESTCAGDGLEQGEIFDMLSHLADKSLVDVETKNAASRFRMLETIRGYAREKSIESGEDETIHRYHLSFMARWMGQVEPKLHSPRQIYGLDQIETEHDNLRVALQWPTDNDVEAGLRLAGSLGWFW